MKKTAIIFLVLLVLPFSAFANEARLGLGGNYWTALDDIEVDNVDDNGYSVYGSFQYWITLIGIEADIEILPDKYGENAIDPQVWLLVGSGVYAGAGVGIEYRDGSFADEPFYALRVGLNFEIIPSLNLDIYGTYRFNDTAELDNVQEEIDTDAVFLGTAVRIAF